MQFTDIRKIIVYEKYHRWSAGNFPDEQCRQRETAELNKKIIQKPGNAERWLSSLEHGWRSKVTAKLYVLAIETIHKEA